MVRVVVADDHAVVRTGLQLIFQDHGIRILAEANNGEELIKNIYQQMPDVAIIDLNMPGKDSLDLIRHIKRLFPLLPLVIFTMSRDEQLATRLMRLGALAFINKEENPEELINAIKSAVKGKTYLTLGQKNRFASQYVMGQKETILHERLTDREYQIMCLLATGIPKNKIAEKLNISKNTLSNHRNNILKKLQVLNNSELTKYALQHHLIN